MKTRKLKRFEAEQRQAHRDEISDANQIKIIRRNRPGKSAREFARLVARIDARKEQRKND